MSTTTSLDLRSYLRGLPVFAGALPVFDPTDAPSRPEPLFVEWLIAAVAAGVREPHAMTLSTCSADGNPSARVLILKNLNEDGWQFAVHADSPKGRDLAGHPAAALTFYWPALARQVRVRGRVHAEPAERSAADFLARPAASRAEASLGRQSEPLARREDLEQALAQVDIEPGTVVAAWTLYTLRADEVEFWQGDRERKHTRLRYTATDGGWRTGLLWP